MLEGKEIFISGGTGSLGKVLAKHILRHHKVKKLTIFSRDEFKQNEMEKDFPDDNIRFLLGDVRDFDRVRRVLEGTEIVVHAAALKQIPRLEYCPTEAVRTNVDGSLNIVNACLDCGVEKAILISTDKSSAPCTLYGATKLVAEKLFLAANAYNKTKFSAVRYGNVIGSRGSVIPFFQELKRKGIKKFPITDKRMTRFWITLDEAVQLVMDALQDERTGLFIPCVPSMRIIDLARAIEPDCEFKEIGIRAMEKIHESLTTSEERGIIFDGKLMDGWNYTSEANDWWLTEEDFLEGLNVG
jgi:FlaA1/EpsC-like NDP-sugar epimerase